MIDRNAITEALIEKNGIQYDRWIVGKGTTNNRKYVMHLAEPRFIAKFSDQNFDDEDQVDDEELLQSLPIYLEDIVFFNILFFDEPPGDEESLMALFNQTNTAIKYFMLRDI